MKLNYELLRRNVIEVEVIKDLNMGDFDDFLDGTNGIMISGLKAGKDGEAIIVAGTKGKFNVQPYNGWYEMAIDGYLFDVAIDGEDLNDYLKGLVVIGPNQHFHKEA